MMDGSNYVIIASNGGIKKNPGWFYNLKENKDVTIRIKDITK